MKDAQAALVNAPVPDLQAPGWINSRSVDWSSLRGKVVLLDFWSTGCGPCMDSLAKAEALQNKLSKRGFVVIGAAVGQGAKQTEEVVRKLGVSFPMAMVDWETLNRFAGGGVPAYYLIDRQGRIVRGPLRALPIESAIEELLGR